MQPRKRRTAEEARSHILDAAETQLKRQGIAGLNVGAVADAAGTSHANVIHHFGNTDGMRHALAQRMMDRLLHDLLSTLDQDVPVRSLLQDLFEAMSRGGHAKLVAWRLLEDQHHDAMDDHLVSLLRQILDRTASPLGLESRQATQYTVLLVTATAIGLGLTRDMLPHILDMNDGDMDGFADWLAGRLSASGEN